MYAELHTNQAVPDLPGNSEWWRVVNPYQTDPNRLPDSLFEEGSLHHLVVGNEARVLDYRRTPLRVRELKESSGLAVMEILDFEDVGNTWDVPFEDISSFQFAIESKRADIKDLARYEASVAWLNRQTSITCDQDARRATLSELAEAEREAALWLGAQSASPCTVPRLEFSRRTGFAGLFNTLDLYMEHHGLADLEATFASHYVSKLHYSEFVKAHRIAIAEMGLVPYTGSILRDDAVLEGAFNRSQRRKHVIRRLGFVRALYSGLDIFPLLLYRGLHSPGFPQPTRNETFVSATTNLEIAEALSCFREPSNPNKEGYRVGVLMSQRIALERVFMTFVETPQMNHPYRESEVVLLYDEAEAF